MVKIFISYRRADSSHAIGRIYDSLCASYGEENVFKDVDSIPLGEDFREILASSIKACDVLLSIIGKQWNTVTDDAHHGRIHQVDDYVRIEIEEALKNKIPIIPVTIDGAVFPKESDLPDSIKLLSFRNGLNVRPDPDFNRDIRKLKSDISCLIGNNNRYRFFTRAMLKKLMVLSVFLILSIGLYKSLCSAYYEAEIKTYASEFDRFNNSYESNKASNKIEYGDDEIKLKTPEVLDGINSVDDDFLDDEYKRYKYQLLMVFHVLNAEVRLKEHRIINPNFDENKISNKDDKLKSEALMSVENSIEKSNILLSQMDNLPKDSQDFLSRKDFVNYNLAITYAVKFYFGDKDAKSKVDNYLESVSSSYIKEKPVENNAALRLYKEYRHE